MLALTRPDGSEVFLGDGFIVEPAPKAGQVAESANSSVKYCGITHYVRETPDEVKSKIESEKVK